MSDAAESTARRTPVYVGFWKRVVAFIVDNIVLTLVTAPLMYVAVKAGLLTRSAVEAGDAVTNAAMLALSAAFVVLFWKFRGATPGKMLFGARIVDAETLGAPSTGRLIGRYFAYFLSILPLMLGFVWIAFDKHKQGFHDKLARTVVIEDEDN